DIGHGMGAAFVADQKRIAVGEIARAFRSAVGHYEAAIGVVGAPRGDALGDDPAGGVLAEMQHLGAGIDLLVAVRDPDRIEFSTRLFAAQSGARLLPGGGRAGLELGPGDLRALAATVAALGDEIVDAAATAGVARVPVLDGRILDLRVVERDELDHRRVQLILVAHRRGAAFEIAHI